MSVFVSLTTYFLIHIVIRYTYNELFIASWYYNIFGVGRKWIMNGFFNV